MFILKFVLVVLYLSVSTAYNDTDVQRCPSDKASYDAAAQRFRCSGSLSYHCLQNKDGGLTESCHEFILVARDYCPVHKSHDYLDALFCKGRPGCPDDPFFSTEVYKYPACLKYIENRHQSTTHTAKTNDTSSEDTTSTITKQRSSNVFTIITPFVGTFGSVMVFGILIIYYKKRGGTIKHGDVTELKTPLLIDVSDLPHTFKNDIFVKTEAYRKCKEILSENDVVIIRGRLGSGKTTVLKYLAQELEKEDDWLKISSDHIMSTEKSSDGNIIMLWDNCGGRYNLNLIEETKDKLREILKWVKEKKGGGKRKLIVTMSHAASHLVMLDKTINKFNKCNVDLDMLKEGEQKDMFACISEWRCHCTQCKGIKIVDKSELMNKDPSQYITFLGWPLVCRLAAVAKVAEDTHVFCSRPFHQLYQVYDKIKKEKPLLYGILVYLGSNRGIGNLNFMRIDLRFLNWICQENITASTDEEKKILSEELKLLLDTVPELVQCNGPDWYVLWHEVISLTIFCHFYRSDKCAKSCVVAEWDLTMLTELLRPEGYNKSLYEKGISVLLEETDQCIKDIGLSSQSKHLTNHDSTFATLVSLSPEDNPGTSYESSTTVAPLTSHSPEDSTVTSNALNQINTNATLTSSHPISKLNTEKWCLELPKEYWKLIIRRLIPEYHRYENHYMMTVPEFKRTFIENK